jgi:predicted metal-dependent phosphoesterase TrpH
MYVDLHIHTNASDGTWSVAELLTNLLESHVQIFAITDHDTIANSRIMAETLKSEHPLRFVMGVEISCTYQRKEHHITTYAFDWNNPDLLNLLKSNQQKREDYNARTIRLLEQTYPQIAYSQYQDYNHDRRRGGWKTVSFLFDKGVIASLSDYFRIVKDLDLAVVFNDPAEVIATIKAAQGFAFLAHPNAYCQGNKMPETELQQWIEFGIAGIECYSSYCSLQDAAEYVKFCAKNNLLISGGSDCHGMFLPKQLGTPRVTLDMLNLGFI